MSDPFGDRVRVIRFSSAVEVPSESGWRVVLYRMRAAGVLEPLMDIEQPDATSARLWAVSEARRRGAGHRAVVYRPDGLRDFSTLE